MDESNKLSTMLMNNKNDDVHDELRQQPHQNQNSDITDDNDGCILSRNNDSETPITTNSNSSSDTSSELSSNNDNNANNNNFNNEEAANDHDDSNDQQQVSRTPFHLLYGEKLITNETTNEYQIYLTNYRLFVKNIYDKRLSLASSSMNLSCQQHHLTSSCHQSQSSPKQLDAKNGISNTVVRYQNGGINCDSTNDNNTHEHVTILNDNISNNNDEDNLQQDRINKTNNLNYNNQQINKLNEYHHHMLYDKNQPKEFFIPINNIDYLEIRDIYFLTIYTKYIESFVITFDNNESVQQWYKRLCDMQEIDYDKLFCFQYYRELNRKFNSSTFTNDSKDNDVNNNNQFERLKQQKHQLDRRLFDLYRINEKLMTKMYSNYDNQLNKNSDEDYLTRIEFERLDFDVNNWRICNKNNDFKFSHSYPKSFIVPNSISDDDLEYIANFRYSRRIPVVVWRNKKNGCVIMRSSQPIIGWFGYRCNQDEIMLQTVLKICQKDNLKINKEHIVDDKVTSHASVVSNGNATIANGNSDFSINKNKSNTNGLSNGNVTKSSIKNYYEDQQQHESNDENDTNNKLLILDARSYTAAFANRAMGGGCECPEYYTNCDIQFMSLNNIHSIRKSFYSLRYICESSQIDQSNWYTLLDNTKWLHNLASLLKAAIVVVDAVTIQKRPVLVHCSDGWDRTPQVIALAELMLDPYYRTIDGFQILIQKEWLQYGHKFSDRCRSSLLNIDPNERCPVFLQWVDCVHQLLKQFPREFEFNVCYLMKLVYHSYSCLFGTFICNNVQERYINQVYSKTISLWSYFEMNRSNFINYLYMPTLEVLRPSCRVKDIIFWNEIYVPVSNNCNYMTANMAISSSCNGICNVTNRTSTVTALNMPNDELLDYYCNHDIKCQSQSKCDLNRSASYESLANYDMKQQQQHLPAAAPSKQSTTTTLNNTLHYHNDKSNLNQLFDQTSNLMISKQHLSDTCLLKRYNQFIINQTTTNGFMMMTNVHGNNDMDNKCDDNRIQSKKSMINHDNNNNHNKNYEESSDIEDCYHYLRRQQQQQQQQQHQKQSNQTFNSKPLISDKRNNDYNNLSLTSTSNKSATIHSLIDIDGQLLNNNYSYNNNNFINPYYIYDNELFNRSQLQQLIFYHKNMIKRLTRLLNFEK